MENILDILLDEENRDPIVLADKNGRRTTFEQIAVIPYGDGDDRAIYAVLKPATPFAGVADDEAIVFRVDEDERGDTVLCIELDEMIAVEVFHSYYDLLDEAENDKRKNTN